LEKHSFALKTRMKSNSQLTNIYNIYYNLITSHDSFFQKRQKSTIEEKEKKEIENYHPIISFRHIVNGDYICYGNFFLYSLVATFLEFWFVERFSQRQEICNEMILDMNCKQQWCNYTIINSNSPNFSSRVRSMLPVYKYLKKA